MKSGEELPAELLVEYHYYCPNKMKEGTLLAALPAFEVCPNPDCESPKGKGAGQCNFLVSSSSVYFRNKAEPVSVSLPSFTSEFNIGDVVKTVGTKETAA